VVRRRRRRPRPELSGARRRPDAALCCAVRRRQPCSIRGNWQFLLRTPSSRRPFTHQYIDHQTILVIILALPRVLGRFRGFVMQPYDALPAPRARENKTRPRVSVTSASSRSWHGLQFNIPQKSFGRGSTYGIPFRELVSYYTCSDITWMGQEARQGTKCARWTPKMDRKYKYQLVYKHLEYTHLEHNDTTAKVSSPMRVHFREGVSTSRVLFPRCKSRAWRRCSQVADAFSYDAM
jgi:hypothetical protein